MVRMLVIGEKQPVVEGPVAQTAETARRVEAAQLIKAGAKLRCDVCLLFGVQRAPALVESLPADVLHDHVGAHATAGVLLLIDCVDTGNANPRLPLTYNMFSPSTGRTSQPYLTT